MEILPIPLAIVAVLSIAALAFAHSRYQKLNRKYIELQSKLTDWQDRPKSVELEEFLADLLTEGQAVVRMQPIAVRDILIRAQNSEKRRL